MQEFYIMILLREACLSVMQDAGEPVIVDFGNAIVVDRKKRKAFKGEMEKLCHVLGRRASEKGPHS
jgi:hypothetical protein